MRDETLEEKLDNTVLDSKTTLVLHRGSYRHSLDSLSRYRCSGWGNRKETAAVERALMLCPVGHSREELVSAAQAIWRQEVT